MKRLLPCLLLGASYACQSQPAQPAREPAPADRPVKVEVEQPTKVEVEQPTIRPPTRPSLELDIPLLEPGVAIGHFKLGATLDALTAAGHKIEPHPSGQLGDTVKVSGPFQLVFTEQGRLTSIELDLTRSQLRHGTAQSYVILSDKTPVEELRKALGCGPIEVLEGGNTATCVGGTRFEQAGPILKPSVRVLVGPTGPKP